jgi:predicted HAD superfamily Cof-like phosphohydrolase
VSHNKIKVSARGKKQFAAAVDKAGVRAAVDKAVGKVDITIRRERETIKHVIELIDAGF